jgi:hypothetical protein
MAFSNVKLIPLYGSVDMNLNATFLNRFKAMCSTMGIVEVEITSAVRKEYKGSFHYSGEAIDINSVKYSNGKKGFFHALNVGYNSNEDRKFFDAVKSNLGDLLQEYISPAIIKTAGSNSRNNIYWSAGKDDIKKALALKAKKGKYDSDIWHLDHLHFAIAKRFSKTEKVAATGGGLLLLGLGLGGYWYWRKNKNVLYLP